MRLSLRLTIGVAAMVAILAMLTEPAFADESEGAYVGAGVGFGRIEASTPALTSSIGQFDENHFAYRLDFGIHPPSVPVALELEYLDLGESHAASNLEPEIASATVSQRGGGLFLLYYLPTPIVQPYIKAGGSRLTTHASVLSACSGNGCNLATESPTNNAFAFGAGVQWAFGRWALRGEYEHFNAGGGHPSALTVGVDWTFL